MCRRVALAVVTLLVAGVVIAGQQRPESPAQAPNHVRPNDNFYGASNRILIDTPVGGDVVAAARVLDINHEVAGDVLAAGWRVSLARHAFDDVRMAGGEVQVNAPVDGDLTLAGGDVTVGPQAHVAGRAWLTGSTVRIDGVFNRELQIAGGTVDIAGEVRQPLTIVAETLRIHPTAKILAALNYKSPREAQVMDGASVAGPITYTRIDAEEARRARSRTGVSSVLFVVNLFVAGLLFFLLLPRVAAAGVETLRAQPGRSLLLGFALLVCTPLAALILVVTVIGLPIGVSLVALYLVALLFGVLTAAYCIGELEATWLRATPTTTLARRAAVLAAGVLTLAALRAIVGGLAVFAAILFGLGALALWTYRTCWRGVAAVAR